MQTPVEFKRKYPRQFKKLISIYGGKDNICDLQAAVNLYVAGVSPPTCSVCGSKISIGKKFRDVTSVGRCKIHANTNNIIPIDHIHQSNIHSYEIISIPNNPVMSLNIELCCKKHGAFSQKIGNYLAGMKCQSCAAESRPRRTIVSDWINESAAKFNNYYDYSLVEFRTIADQVTIICPVHGKFIQGAGVHKRGHNCPKCSNEKNASLLTRTNDEFISTANSVHNHKYSYGSCNYTSSRQKVTIKCPVHGEFEQVAYYHLAGNGCPQCGIEQTTYKSAAEYEIIEWLKSAGISNIVHSDRRLGFELDIWLPDYNVAIEYNGVYWHSSGSQDLDKAASEQHLRKTEVCEKNGIQLLHILDIEWKTDIGKELWKSTILHKLHLTPEKIYARKCTLVAVENKVATQFFKENHLQGPVSGKVNIGLSYNGVLVSVATFSKSRYREKETNTHEILRFASIKNLSVIGGFSKIIKEFERTHTGKIISYANRRWSTGQVYKQTQFTLAKISGPCYYYTDCKKLWHRSIFQKHKLKDQLEIFDSTRTEVENMYDNKYRRIWDCGHMVFEKEIT